MPSPSDFVCCVGGGCSTIDGLGDLGDDLAAGDVACEAETRSQTMTGDGTTLLGRLGRGLPLRTWRARPRARASALTSAAVASARNTSSGSALSATMDNLGDLGDDGSSERLVGGDGGRAGGDDC